MIRKSLPLDLIRGWEPVFRKDHAPIKRERAAMGSRLLVLVRHGESEWNKKNLFTGWRDPDLTETGIKEARRGGILLKNKEFAFDIAFTSVLERAQHTLALILEAFGQRNLEIVKDQALNERDYGELSGLNKD